MVKLLVAVEIGVTVIAYGLLVVAAILSWHR